VRGCRWWWRRAPSSADGVEEMFGPKKEPGGVGITEAMVVSRKERHLLVVIDDGITSLGVRYGRLRAEAGEIRGENVLEGHSID